MAVMVREEHINPSHRFRPLRGYPPPPPPPVGPEQMTFDKNLAEKSKQGRGHLPMQKASLLVLGEQFIQGSAGL